MTQVSPSYVRNGVLGVSLNQLSPGKKNPLVNTKKNWVRNGHSKNAIFPHKKEKAHIFPTIKEILGPL